MFDQATRSCCRVDDDSESNGGAMFRFLFSPYGRVSLGTYWGSWLIPSYIVTTALTMLDKAIAMGGTRPFLGIWAMLLILWPSIALATKRLHDRGMSGWWQLGWWLVYAGLIVAGFLAGRAQIQGAPNPLLAIVNAPFDGANPLIIIASALISGLAIYVVVNLLFLPGLPGANKYCPAETGADIADTFS